MIEPMKVPVWVGYCKHDFIRAAVVARYSRPDDLQDMGSRFRLELIEGPVTLKPCPECEGSK